MITIVLYLIIYMIPAGILGYLLLLLFPHIPAPLLVLVNMTIIVGGFFAYKNKMSSKREADGSIPEMPDWLKGKRVPIFLAIATLIASLLVNTANKTDLYIDNATGNAITVKVSHAGTFTIPSGKYKKLTVVKGDIAVEYNGKKKNFSMPDIGNWVLNLDKANAYFLTSVQYSSHVELFRKSNGSTTGDSPGFAIIKDEFFNAKVDYVFDVPEKITIKRSRFGSKDDDVKKMVLYRRSEYLGSDEPEEVDTDLPVTIDEEKAETKPAKNSKAAPKTNRRDEK